MSYQQPRQRFQPPELYSISKGLVSRIEPYGCFVKLHSSPISGLVHISQLHANKIENVNDVVSLDDEVWVKVMNVEVESIEDESTGRTRQRHKVKLSMKYVHQDTGQDLDPGNEQLEEDMQRSSSRGAGGGSGGGRGNNAIDGTGGANSLLGRALASNIGMSSAIDPGNLILKGKSSADAAIANSSFNGYALVGEDEGEPSPPPPPVIMDHVGEVKRPEPSSAMVRPMGRGRGTTLPAWMTRKDNPEGGEGRLGSMNGVPQSSNLNEKEDDSRNKKSDKHDNKRHRRKHGKKHKDRKKRSSRDHQRRRRGRSRSQSSHSSCSASPSIASDRSRSRSPNELRRSSHNRKKKSHKHHRHDGRRRRDDSGSRSRSHSNHSQDGKPDPRRSRHHRHQPSNGDDFTNAEEARAIMERLERRRREG